MTAAMTPNTMPSAAPSGPIRPSYARIAALG